MQSDALTRVLLAVIAACLVILVVQGFGDGSGSQYRYQVTAIRAGTPLLIRTDMVTGKVWKSELRGGRGRWIAFSDPEDSALPAQGDEAPADESPAATPSRDTEPETSLSLEEDMSLLDTAGLEPLEPPAAVPEPQAAAPAPFPTHRTRNSEPVVAPFEQLEKAASRADLPPDIRIWALRLLGDSADPRSTVLLLTALEDDNTRVVTAALGALGGRRDARVTEAVRKLQDHPDPGVQAAAKAHLDAPS